MPYVFQQEINKEHPHYTGCEKFDSLFHLYEIFKNPSYFLINLFFGVQEILTISEIAGFLQSTAQEYGVSHYVVRCEKKSEKQPVEARAFANIDVKENLEQCASYIKQRVEQGYNCIVHEVISGNYPSNRLDWLYSFGILYRDSLPQIEIYPATDASSIKWGKLSPLDFITTDQQLRMKHTTVRDEGMIEKYREAKLAEWTQQFQREISDTLPEKSCFVDVQSLGQLLKQRNHPIFDLHQIDEAVERTQQQLFDIGLKYGLYARKNNISPDQSVIHGSLLFNNRMIVWDISTNQRWQYLESREK